MASESTFGSVQAKMVGVHLVLYVMFCLTSFMGLLRSAGIISSESYYDFMFSSFVQNVYFSELMNFLANGWMLLIVIFPVIVAFSVASWADHGGSTSGDATGLSIKLIAVNLVTLAVLSPITFAGVLGSIKLLPDEALFRFLNSGFIEGLYGHEYSWSWVVTPFLLIAPLVLTICARSWYAPQGTVIA